MTGVRRRLFVAMFVLLVQAFRPVRPGPVFLLAQTTDRFVTVNGLRLHVLDSGGDRPPLILLHGIARHAHTFDHVAPEFAKRYRVLAVDMRGHGDSAWSPDG